MKLWTYENHYMKEYHRSYKLLQLRKESLKKFSREGLYGIRTFVYNCDDLLSYNSNIIITCFLFSYCFLVTHTETEVNNLPPKEVAIFAIFHLRHKYLGSTKLQLYVTNFSGILLNFFSPYYYITSD